MLTFNDTEETILLPQHITVDMIYAAYPYFQCKNNFAMLQNKEIDETVFSLDLSIHCYQLFVACLTDNQNSRKRLIFVTDLNYLIDFIEFCSFNAKPLDLLAQAIYYKIDIQNPAWFRLYPFWLESLLFNSNERYQSLTYHALNSWLGQLANIWPQQVKDSYWDIVKITMMTEDHCIFLTPLQVNELEKGHLLLFQDCKDKITEIAIILNFAQTLTTQYFCQWIEGFTNLKKLTFYYSKTSENCRKIIAFSGSRIPPELKPFY